MSACMICGVTPIDWEEHALLCTYRLPKYTHYPSNEGNWWGMPRNQWGIEIPPAPRIPYLLWPIAIVGALLFAHAVNVTCKR